MAQGTRRLLVSCAWLVAWQVASVAVGTKLILPGPLSVCARLVGLVAEPSFWLTVMGTLGRVAQGFSLAFVAALLAGGASVRHPILADVLQPALAVLKGAPIVCVIVVLLMWVGSRGVPVVAAFVVTFPSTYFALREGLLGLDAGVGEMLRVFRVGRVRRALAHAWPGAVPYLAAACEASCPMAFKAGVAAELLGTPLGSVGERIYQAKLLLETTDVLAWTLATVLVASLLSHAFVALLRRSAVTARRLSVLLGACVAGADPGLRPIPLSLTGVRVSYDGHVVLDGLTCTFDAGARVVVTDPSGAGKTTLLSVAAGLRDVEAGRVEVGPASVVFQESRLIGELSSIDNVTLASGADPAAASAALAEVVPGIDAGAPVSTLSGGQRRRVELARAMLAPSSVVLLDEPFSALDETSHATCCRFVLARLAGRTLVVASHDVRDARLLDAEAVSLFRD